MKENEAVVSTALPEGNFEYAENTQGITFAKLLIPYMRNASKITIVDPYLRTYWQLRNLMELLQDLIRNKTPDAEIEIRIVSSEDEFNPEKQSETLSRISEAVSHAGIRLAFRFDDSIHDRYISTDTGWKIIMGRGLDIFQNYDGNNTFSLQNALPEYRSCKSFGITYVRTGNA